MANTFTIGTTLLEYDGILYEAIQARIVLSKEKFEEKSLALQLIVTDDVNTVEAFSMFLSGNRKELAGYFTVDAFTGFSTNSTVKCGYTEEDFLIFENIDVITISPLAPEVASIPHQIADNAWLATIS